MRGTPHRAGAEAEIGLWRLHEFINGDAAGIISAMRLLPYRHNNAIGVLILER